MNSLLRYKWIQTTTVVLGIMSGFAAASDVMVDPTTPLVDLNRDPMAINAPEEQKKTTSLVLNSVINRNGRKIAVINNRLLKVGQVIEGYKVTGITPYGAELTGEGETLSLTLMNVKIKNQ